jgi:23S rRNA (cytidine1920-2'-O)/16S rRNA (cytidine1409-2'-O)-methyltransferase
MESVAPHHNPGIALTASPNPRPASKVRQKGAGKQRVDQMLVDRGLAESRARAQALVLAGLVFSGESKLAKPGQTVAADAPLEVRGRDHPWVSRGGIKLAHALDHFGLDPAGATAMDVGSSTGGFTDVLLSRGALRVFAVDSGTNQLAWKLRQDARVTVLEQTSARVLTPAQIDGQGAGSSAAAGGCSVPVGRADQATVRGRARRGGQGRRGPRRGAS